MSHVGIFWFVPANLGGWSALVADMAPVEDVPADDGVKRYPGNHAEVWAGLARLGERRLRAIGCPRVIAQVDYRTYPRGRVEFEVGGRRFIVRADGRLTSAEFVRPIVALFGLPMDHLTVLQEPSLSRTGRWVRRSLGTEVPHSPTVDVRSRSRPFGLEHSSD